MNPPQPPSPYESPKLLGEYLLLHYGTEEDLRHESMPIHTSTTATPFPVRCVRELLDQSLVSPDATALEVGCSVGASAFELTRSCSRVEASDFSQSFITTASTIQREGCVTGFRMVEGDIWERFVAAPPPDIDRSRVVFSVADATNLPDYPSTFDVVLAANLICRLTDPDAFLQRAAKLVKPGGQLLLTTPFTWLEEYTPRERWIGGTSPGLRSETELSRRLEVGFRLHRRRNLPFLIREHERKYQLGIALGTCWVRR